MTKDIKISKIAGFNDYCIGLGVPLKQRIQVSNKIKTCVFHKLFCIYSAKFTYSFDFSAKLLIML